MQGKMQGEPAGASAFLLRPIDDTIELHRIPLYPGRENRPNQLIERMRAGRLQHWLFLMLPLWCVLAGELLREAEQLVAQKVHPMTIIAGQRNSRP